MPIEIKELIIRAVVSDDDDDGADRARANEPARAEDADREAAIVRECVRQVMKILERSRER